VWWAGGSGLFAVLLIIGGLYLLSPGFSWRTDTPIAPAASTPITQDVAPETPRPPRPKRRGGLGALTFGVLFVGGGVVGLVLAAGNTIEPTYVFAIGLLIVGAALVVSTWFGRSFVLIPLGVVLAGLMSVSTLIDVPITGGIGDKQATPLTLADLHDEYHLGMGELRLDLSHLTFERGTAHTVRATVGIGSLRVTVPRNATVELHGHAGVGELRLFGQRDEGIRVDRDTTLAAGENAPRIVLEVEVGLGEVRVSDETP
jgi:predicted membrane protein